MGDVDHWQFKAVACECVENTRTFVVFGTELGILNCVAGGHTCQMKAAASGCAGLPYRVIEKSSGRWTGNHVERAFPAQVCVDVDGIVRALVRKGRGADRFDWHLNVFPLAYQLENALAARDREGERYGPRL